MSSFFVFIEEHELLFERFEVKLELREILELFDTFLDDPRVATTKRKLCDLRKIESIGMTEQELGELLDLIAKHYLRDLKHFEAGAFLVENATSQHIAEMFLIRLPTAFQPLFRIFTSPSEGLAFLGLPATLCSEILRQSPPAQSHSTPRLVK